MDNMQRSVLVRRFLLLLGDLYAHQLRPEPRPESVLKPRRDKVQRPAAKHGRYESAENSWYPKAPATLLDLAADDVMKQAGGAPTVG
jgi:hypothetical protein